MVTLGEPYFLLASFTRKQAMRTKDGVPVLSLLPLLGPLFTRSQTNSTLRNVMVLARPVTMGSSVAAFDLRGAPPASASAAVPATPAPPAKASRSKWGPVPGPSPGLSTNQPPLVNGRAADPLH